MLDPDDLDLEAQPVAHLPVLRALIDQLQIHAILDEALPKHCLSRVSDADCVVAMMLNILCGRVALFRMDEWLARTDVELLLGHRRAIDALIATHSVVMDTSGRELWVSEGPHASGRYVRFRLTELLASGFRAQGPARVETLPGDDILEDGRYEGWVGAGSPHPGAE